MKLPYTLTTSFLISTLGFLVSVHLLPLLDIKTANEAIYTDEEKTALQKLWKLVDDLLDKDYMRRDEYLIHWLRAKNLDVIEAEELLQKSLDWRKSEDIESIADEMFPEFEDDYKTDLTSTDDIGRPVLLVASGTWEIANISNSKDKELKAKFNRYITKMGFEIPIKMSREIGESNGSNCTQYLFIIDLDGLEKTCFTCLDIYDYYTELFEKRYPDFQKIVIALNVPWYFKVLFNALLPLYSELLSKHCKILGYDQNEWRTTYEEFNINLELLPKAFGGNRTHE